MANPDAGLIFDAGLNYDISFKKIAEQLNQIINNIEKSGGTKISFSIDENSIKQIEQRLSGLNIGGQNSAINKAIQKTIQGQNIPIPTQFVSANGENVKGFITNLKNQIAAATNEPVTIKTLTTKDKDGKLQVTKATVEYLNKNLGITEQRIYSVKKAGDQFKATLEQINNTDKSVSADEAFKAKLQNITKIKTEADTLSQQLNNINPDYQYKNTTLNDVQNTLSVLQENIAVFEDETRSVEARTKAYEQTNALTAQFRKELTNLKAQEKQFDKSVSADDYVTNLKAKLPTYRENIKKYTGIVADEKSGNTSYTDIDATIKAMEKEVQAFNASTASLKEKQEAYKKLIQLSNTYAKQTQNLSAQTQTATAQHKDTVALSNLQAEVQKIWNQHGNEIYVNPDIYKRFKAVQSKLSGQIGGNGYASVDKASEDVANLKAELNDANIYADSLGVSLKKLFGVHLKTQLTMAAIHLLSDGLNQIIEDVKAVDSALTQLQIVTGESGYSIEKFADKAFDASKKIGASALDIMSSTETWARLGYSLDESLDLAKITSMFANVGDISVDDATTSMTSILKAYSDTLDVSDAERIADILVDVGAKYAVSAGGLGEALQRGGAALEAANNSLEESIALITAGNSAVNKIAA